MKITQFQDRTHAGKTLAGMLAKYADRDDVIVLALPRGGVPVAYEVAEQLHAPLDVLVLRKREVACRKELAMGAVADGDIHGINEDVLRHSRIPHDVVAAATATKSKVLHSREKACRSHTDPLEVAEKIVILVDDGIAKETTMRAAIDGVRQLGPKLIVVAVPTVGRNALTHLEPLADDFVAVIRPGSFASVNQWYEEFAQVSDAEVAELLSRARQYHHSPPCID